jgi:hypothetical protein
MQANAILAGLEYAYTDFPSRGITYYHGAKRIRVLHVYKVEGEYSRSKRQTLVECVLLDAETGEPLINPRTGEQYPVKTIRARQVVATWQDHLIEAERHEEAARKRREEQDRYWAEHQERLRKQAEERQRELEEQRRIQEEKDNETYAILDSAGIPRDLIMMYPSYVRIERDGLLEEVSKHTEQSIRP